MEKLNEWRSHGGWQRVYKHASTSTKTDMTFSVFVPPQAEDGTKVPVLWFLSGLTCTWENATTKAGFQKRAAELGVMVVCPDTSPRGDGVPDDDNYDFGQGAGFYVDATESPWAEHFQMWSYVTQELPTLVFSEFPARKDAQGITGHSMGGHGALTVGLTHAERFKFVGAFAPIVHPMVVPWGKALSGYLGDDEGAHQKHDTCALLRAGARFSGPLVVDQGTADNFLEEQLQTLHLERACKESGQDLDLEMREGYDHSYYFVSSFIDRHLEAFVAAVG